LSFLFLKFINSDILKFDVKNLLNNMYFAIIIIFKLRITATTAKTGIARYCCNCPAYVSIPYTLSECPAIRKWKDGYSISRTVRTEINIWFTCRQWIDASIITGRQTKRRLTLLSPEMWLRVVWWTVTKVSEEAVASFRVDGCSWFFEALVICLPVYSGSHSTRLLSPLSMPCEPRNKFWELYIYKFCNSACVTFDLKQRN
jgi:hypothetical protein